MLAKYRQALIGCVWLLLASILTAQTPQIPPPKVEPPPSRDIVAARVNGQSIPELSVYRSLMRVPPARRDEARKDVLNYLIDNTIIDQYLLQLPDLKNAVEPQEVEKHIATVKKEAADSRKDFKQVLADLLISEDELRTELIGALRWDKFVLKYGSDAALEKHFKDNVEMFNGSRVRARHILIPIEEGKRDTALATISTIKKQIDGEVAQAIAKLPATTDAITREKERAKTLEAVFTDAATKHSTCPSKKAGGDLDYFPRVGKMVEPFAKAAFALKQYQMSEPVATEFGYHLILAVDSKPGKDVKFADVKPFVQEVYSERLREAILTQYKAKSKIEIVERKK
jgi:peptidyl-prolyl cis-trans isomerase C